MRVGGKIFVKADGQQYRAKGNWTYNLGIDRREGVVGSDRVHGYKEMPQLPFIEGVITDSGNLSAEALLSLKDATVILELANGKIVSLSESWFAGDGNITTEEGEIEARFEGIRAEEIR